MTAALTKPTCVDPFSRRGWQRLSGGKTPWKPCQCALSFRRYDMKTTHVEKNVADENDAAHGGSPAERVGEPGVEPATRRWELTPILLQGQPAGWRVVKIN